MNFTFDKSDLLGKLDCAYPLIQPKIFAQFFKNGLGNYSKYEESIEFALKHITSENHLPPKTIKWTKAASGDNYATHDGTFLSPLAEYLPEESRICHIRFIHKPAMSTSTNIYTKISTNNTKNKEISSPLPSDCSTRASSPRRSDDNCSCDIFDKSLKGIVLIFAATGDQSYHYRQLMMAQPLLDKYQIASILVTPPFYGARRPVNQRRHFIDTVADWRTQSAAQVIEGLALLKWLRDELSSLLLGHIPLGVSGCSWGGSMAAAIGVASLGPVGIIPCLGSSDSSPFCDSLLSSSIDWKNLQKDVEEDAQALFKKLVQENSVSHLIDIFPKHLIDRRVIVQVSATHDRFCTIKCSNDLENCLKKALGEDGFYEHRWIPGGHTSSFIWEAGNFVKAIKDTFDRLASSARSLETSDAVAMAIHRVEIELGVK
eukprot:GHVL01000555.1.p1 GENE.GHVL01000555.1~~GHVL01000555.1.p1  ORF type:complete len:430 (+),score=69.25 GHVL01000555.1:32-1321(+)